MRIEVVVGDLVQRTGDDQAQVGYSVAGRSRCLVTLCAVCTVHMETRSASFLVWPQNQGQQVFRLEPQNQQLQFGDLATKSPRRFLGLGLKTNWATIYWLFHKTGGRMKTTLDMHQDLAAC
jgi:hypothetical protein